MNVKEHEDLAYILTKCKEPLLMEVTSSHEPLAQGGSNNHKLNMPDSLLKQPRRKEENGSAVQPRGSCLIQV